MGSKTLRTLKVAAIRYMATVRSCDIVDLSWSVTAFRFLLILPCGGPSGGDRSFSLLERVRSQLRFTMTQEGIVVSCLMAATFDVLSVLDPRKII